MFQDLAVLIIITTTLFYIGFSFIKSLRTKKVSSGCGGCTGCELSKKDAGCKT